MRETTKKTVSPEYCSDCIRYSYHEDNAEKEIIIKINPSTYNGALGRVTRCSVPDNECEDFKNAKTQLENILKVLSKKKAFGNAQVEVGNAKSIQLKDLQNYLERL